MSHPLRTVVTLKPGTVLTDAQRENLLTEAIKRRYREQLSKSPPDDIEKISRALAKELVKRSNACGERQLQKDLGNRIELTAPDAKECESLAEIIGDIIEFRYPEGPRRDNKAYRAVKKTTGLLWHNLRKSLGLPELRPDLEPGNAADGPRG